MLLTIKEVAASLKISPSLAYRLVATGEIPCYEIAGCKRVAEEELRAYLQRNRKQIVRLPRGEKRHF